MPRSSLASRIFKKFRITNHESNDPTPPSRPVIRNSSFVIRALARAQCPGEDSNLHAVSGTRSLVWPVYQFQHLGNSPHAPKRTRTSTGLRPLDPESSASTNSATGARPSFVPHAPGEIRTPDLLIRSQTLYPAELRAHNRPEIATDAPRARSPQRASAPRRNRTFNLGIKSPLLCQLS